MGALSCIKLQFDASKTPMDTEDLSHILGAKRCNEMHE
jgi:hypothetical protein